MKIGLIGAGLQGRRRALAILESGDELVVIADINLRSAKNLADELGCEATTSWKKLVTRKDLEVVVICTPNYLHAPMSIAAMRSGNHVLCEKPLATNSEEAKEVLKVAKDCRVKLKCGFNLRYHAGICQAKEWFDRGLIGDLSFLRCRYGTCGKLGLEKDWRANAEMAGGGELLDQGIHALDLFHWFAGDFSQVVGFGGTMFWDITPLEDNAFALLRTSKGQIASLHASWTQWKNLFSFEIFGKDGYILVDGLGGLYGVERVFLGRRSHLSPLKERLIEFRSKDQSLTEEWKDFITAIKRNIEPLGNGYDGLIALKMAEAIYQSFKKGFVVNL